MTNLPELPKELVCRKYLEQQIYLEPDTIIDRMNTVKFQAPGSGKVINKMVEIFCSSAEKYNFSDNLTAYLSFIEELAYELGFEQQNALDNFTKRYNEMKKGGIFDYSIYFMTVLSSIIETFQKKVVNRLSLRLQRKCKSKKKEEVSKNLHTLSQTSNTTLSLLINIEIMKEMGRLIGVQMTPILTDSYEKELISVLKKMK
ncbi:MAG: hypothetical protein ACXACR_09910 [Candidatus Hodarchaeales archaeon]